MSRKGCSPDNAACEGFFGRLKTELFYPRDWKTTTIEQFIQILDSYIRWYNEKRIKISLGSLSPIEYQRALDLRHKPVQGFVRIPTFMECPSCDWTTGLIRTKPPPERVAIQIRWVDGSPVPNEGAWRCRPLQ